MMRFRFSRLLLQEHIRKISTLKKKQLPGYPFPFPLDFHLKTPNLFSTLLQLWKKNGAKKPAKTKSTIESPNSKPPGSPPTPSRQKKTSPNNLKLQNPQLTQYFFRSRTWAPTMADRDSPGFFVPSDSWVLEDSSNDGDRWEKSRSPSWNPVATLVLVGDWGLAFEGVYRFTFKKRGYM